MLIRSKLSQKEAVEFLAHPNNWITIAAYGTHHLCYCGAGTFQGFLIWKRRRTNIVWFGGQRKQAVKKFNELIAENY